MFVIYDKLVIVAYVYFAIEVISVRRRRGENRKDDTENKKKLHRSQGENLRAAGGGGETERA